MFNAISHEQEITAYNERRDRIGSALVDARDMLDVQTFKHALDMFAASRECRTMAEGREFLDEIQYDILCGFDI